MERVNKGEKYWHIQMFCDLIEVKWITEENWSEDRGNLVLGNYFHTKEEAEVMARKIKAVLKGAEVIEMPSGDEINSNSAEFNPFPTNSGEGTLSGYANGLHTGFSAGFNTCAEWLKSKIVK